ncbi:MAG: helix-turn-helix transcriptional regulator [Cyanobacteria bacterium J06627_32]
MTVRKQNPLGEANSIHDVDYLKGWIGSGSLSVPGWMVDHVWQPADEVIIPAIPEHVLVLDISAEGQGSDRQIRRIAGQEHDGQSSRNNFAIIPAGIPSEFAWNGEDEAMNFGFQPQILRKIALETGCMNPDQVELKPLVSGQDPQITRLAQALLYEISTQGEGTLLCTQSLLTAFSIHLLRHYCVFNPKLKAYKSGLSKQQLQQTLAYIHGKVEEGTHLDDLSLSDLAAQTRLSEYHFARQFKTSTGETPAAFVCRLRMEKAAERLRNRPQKTIRAIANSVGYSDPASFAKAFRRQMGVNPSAYRKEC